MNRLSTRTMGRRIRGLVLALFSAALCLQHLQAPAAAAGKPNLATITGAVLDNKGNPVSGALISLLRDGANKIIKQTRSDAAGHFSARISPGRYGIRAIAAGFNEVVFASFEVRPSQELVYRFNLEPIGSGNTLPERRKDRDDVKWTLRAAQTRRSIFQVQEGEDADIEAVLGRETADTESSADSAGDVTGTPDTSEAADHQTQRRVQGVLETYFAGNSFGPNYPGLNFAVATSPNDRVELIFAGQTTGGPNGPERFEASTHLRPGFNHRVGITVGTVQFGEPSWLSNALAQQATQVSVWARFPSVRLTNGLCATASSWYLGLTTLVSSAPAELVR